MRGMQVASENSFRSNQRQHSWGDTSRKRNIRSQKGCWREHVHHRNLFSRLCSSQGNERLREKIDSLQTRIGSVENQVNNAKKEVMSFLKLHGHNCIYNLPEGWEVKTDWTRSRQIVLGQLRIYALRIIGCYARHDRIPSEASKQENSCRDTKCKQMPLTWSSSLIHQIQHFFWTSCFMFKISSHEKIMV